MRKLLTISSIFLSLLLVIQFLDLDIRISSLFYDNSANHQWIYANAHIWKFMYKYGNMIPNFFGIIAITTSIVVYVFMSKLVDKETKKKILLVALLFLIAPGLIVQTLKVSWGRPRPNEIVNFGGKYEFHTPLLPNTALLGNKHDGNSFPSGHAANAFFMIFPFYVSKKRKYLFLGAIGAMFGILMSITRIVQGGHFLSDVVSSMFIVYITAEVLKMVLIDKSIKE